MDSAEVEYVLGAPYHPQSQGAIETFNKTIQKALSKTYDNTKKNEQEKFVLEVNLHQFLHYYNWKRQHTTIWQIPKYVIDNFNDQNIREIVCLATERSRKKHLEYSWYKVDKKVLITNKNNKINLNKNTL